MVYSYLHCIFVSYTLSVVLSSVILPKLLSYLPTILYRIGSILSSCFISLFRTLNLAIIPLALQPAVSLGIHLDQTPSGSVAWYLFLIPDLHHLQVILYIMQLSLPGSSFFQGPCIMPSRTHLGILLVSILFTCPVQLILRDLISRTI